MTLESGSRLGPYEIRSPLGAGGMGEVYRAHDPRLGRDVAVKVLPKDFAADPERLRRFEQEARAAGILNHPALLAVYDLGMHEGAPYVVSELLDGQTLRERLAEGVIPPRKAVEYAVQIALGLSAAHDKGIIHRDLKPENLFLTSDGRMKILDFGLAKLTETGTEVGSAPTLSPDTMPGTILGTAGYMAPEQVKGQVADARADLFAVGAVLYEMLSGKRAFPGDSTMETLSAILREEPQELSLTGRAIPPALERTVRHCLEKNPRERFQSARDLAFDLQALSDLSSPAAILPPAPKRLSRRLLNLVGTVLLIVATAAVAFVVGTRSRSNHVPVYGQLTFQRGSISQARLAPDGHTVVYDALWEGNPGQVFTTRLESPESRPLDLQGAALLGISRQGELAVQLNSQQIRGWIVSGTLARLPLAGGAPREVLEDVQWADWGPDGESLAVVRDAAGRSRLEFPIGTVLYESSGWISHPRVSSAGDHVAFIEHPTQGDDGGNVAVVDRSGQSEVLSTGWMSAAGLAWSAEGNEIWFTATRTGFGRALHGVTLSGNERVVDRVMGTMTLHDVAPDGRVLITRDAVRMHISYRAIDGGTERDLSWLDWSLVRALSQDGKLMLFDESGEGGGARYATYIRGTDGSAPVRLGEGAAMDLSPDGRWAVTLTKDTPPHVVLLPTRAGEPRRLDVGNLHTSWALWMPDGKQLLLGAHAPDEAIKLYLKDVENGTPRQVSEDFLGRPSLSPDGRHVAVVMNGRLLLHPLDGGESEVLEEETQAIQVVGWSPDGKELYLMQRGATPSTSILWRFDLATQQSEPWMEIAPADPAGVAGIARVRFASDGRSLAYSYPAAFSNLFLAEGLR